MRRILFSFITRVDNVRTLKVRKDLTYTTSAGGRKGFKWDWSHSGNIIWNAQVAVSTLPDMTSAMKRLNEFLEPRDDMNWYLLLMIFRLMEMRFREFTPQHVKDGKLGNGFSGIKALENAEM